MTRFPDWPERLAAFLAQRSRQAGAWGVNDCASTAFSAIAAITGIDLWPLRQQYTTQKEGLQMVKDRWGGNLEEAVSQIFQKAGYQPIPVLRAQRGDAVLLDGEEGPSLGVVGSDGVYVAAARGFTVLPLRACRRAWRVG